MIFRTELHPAPAATQLSLASQVVTVGSCFSEVIGRQLEKYRINTLTNPFGTIFNPLSACKLLQICAGADVELADSFVENNGRWFSYDFHSSYSASSEEALYELLDETIVKTRRFLKQADLLILTLGTANIFRLNITGETVANCHKLPASNFTRETLAPEEIITAFAETHSLLRELNPKLRIMLTVSPVRHLKDTLELNSVSKAVLRLATHCLTQQLPETDYFPAYELLLDDLRDYRFYKEDLLHPTEMAEKYIWEKFSQAYFNRDFHTFSTDWDTVLRAMAHRPFHPESTGHQAFVQQMLEKLRTLKTVTDVSEQIAYFENQVIIPPVLDEPDEEEEAEDEGLEVSEAEIEAREIDAAADEPTILLPDNATLAPEAISEAALSAAEAGKSLAETESRQRKKKNRRKKKKPGRQPEEIANTDLKANESAPELAPDQAENASQTDISISEPGQVPAEAEIAFRSKSAKKRSNRRKKKALAAREGQTIGTVASEGTSPGASESGSTVEGSQEFRTETQVEPDSRPEALPAAEIQAGSETTKPNERPIRPARQRPERKKKAGSGPETSELPGSEIIAPEPAQPEPVAITAGPETAAGPKSKKRAAKPAGKGKKTKMPDLFANEPMAEAKSEPKTHPVTETIAVPFVPAAQLESAPEINTEPSPVSEPKKTAKSASRTKSSAKKPATKAAKVSPKAPATEAKTQETAPEPATTEIPKKRKPAAKPKEKVTKTKPAKATEASVTDEAKPEAAVKPKAKKTPKKADKAAPKETAKATSGTPKTRSPRKKKDNPEG